MRRVILCVAALTMLLPACSPIGNRPLQVGAIYPTGGGLGEGGIEEYRGVQLAAKLANSEGGVHGRPIALDLQPANSAEAAPEAVKRLNAAGADVILGSYSSVISSKAAQSAARTGALFWETGAVGEVGTAPSMSDRVFRFAPTGASLGKSAITFIRDHLRKPLPESAKPRRYTVVYVDDVYGRSVAEGAIAEIRDSGMELASRVAYDLSHVDYRQIAQDLIRDRTDVLMVVAYLDDGVALRRAVVEAKVPLQATIGTSSSYCHPAFGETLGEQALGVFASDKPDADVVNPEALSREAAKRLVWAREEYGSIYREPMSAAALSGFSGAWALFHYVMPKADEVSSEEVAEAARTTRLKLGSLPNGSGLSFESRKSGMAGANQLAASVIWEWVQPGVRAVVWPPTFATNPIVHFALP
jgi:branched-chain amino acid transport system substrate-binding protein